MRESLLSEDTQSERQKNLSKEESAKVSYTLTEEDERELESVRKQRALLEQRLGKLDPKSAHQEGLKETFILGTGGNRRSGRTL